MLQNRYRRYIRLDNVRKDGVSLRVLTIWQPDTCDCIIEYDSDFKVTDVIARCAEHKGYSGQSLFDKVAEHNRSFNYRSASLEEKYLEKKRIRALGDPEILRPERIREPYPVPLP